MEIGSDQELSEDSAADEKNEGAPPLKSSQPSLNLKTHLSQIEPDEADLLEAQSSSLQQWLQKSAGAPSPELGTPIDDSPSQPAPPPLNLNTEISFRDEAQEAAHSTAAAKDIGRPPWWHDPNTPFKFYARQYASLKSEGLGGGGAGGEGEVNRRLDKRGVMRPFRRKDWVDVSSWMDF